MKLTLGYSTCPNDTFIFDAMIHGRIDTEGLEFEVKLADVEELNQQAFRDEIDITKLSYHAYGKVSNNYILLDSGSALGNNNGPLLISKHRIYPDEVSDCVVAIPGENTTANLLLRIAYPEIKEVRPMLFSDIEEAVLSNEVDAGLIIHENRFTYAERGLKKVLDLGEFWQNKTNSPIPLGGIAIKRSFPKEIQEKVNRVLRRSVEYAFQNPSASYPYVKKHAQEMEEEVMRSHIQLYVNEFTRSLGEEGQKAVSTLYNEAVAKEILPSIEDELFVSDL